MILSHVRLWYTYREMGNNEEITTKKTSKVPSIRRLLIYWLLPVWIVLLLMLALFIFVLVESNFGWLTAWRYLVVILPVFGVLLTLTYIFCYLIPLRPLETGLIVLFIMFGVFMFASVNDNDIALQMRTYLRKWYDITFLATGITIGGLFTAAWAIYNQQRKRKRKRKRN